MSKSVPRFGCAALLLVASLFTFSADAQQVTPARDGMTVSSGGLTLRITALRDDVVRVRMASLVQQFALLATVWTMLVGSATTASAASIEVDYRILATARASTMEQELNDAAQSGYRFSKVMGGKTANGGQEVVIAMLKSTPSSDENVSRYKLLGTTRTSTMQKELQQWADVGYEYLDQTVFEAAFWGKEVVVIMERRGVMSASTSQYRLLATTKTSTMEKELDDAGKDGFMLVGFTVGETAIGGQEIVSVLRKR